MAATRNTFTLRCTSVLKRPRHRFVTFRSRGVREVHYAPLGIIPPSSARCLVLAVHLEQDDFSCKISLVSRVIPRRCPALLCAQGSSPGTARPSTLPALKDASDVH
ncbi:hypothetical protein E2C01_050464 [Portunus trituberculatus]|uniref:Uncharacterized protein n=1 Tax=Portunus trituberculatus TaxID=210409 RepID=A0A5B7GGK1_PORTR|nr:hypothetical protein [Portunus trituberculatus]